MAARQAYEFGPYRLDIPTRRLLRSGLQVPLTPKAFDTLVALVERRDRVVEKTELMKVVWPDSFVEEANLSQTIFVLRKILGNDSGGRPFIETMPRRGYRFVADVREVASEPANGTSPRRVLLPRAVWASAALTAAALVVLGSLALFRGHATALPSNRKVMLAVVPFENLSGDPAQDYFSHGLTDEMSTELGRLEPNRLGVVATGSVAQRAAQEDARQLGTALGVDYLLEGSVRRDGARVRIAARLVQVSDRRQIWADDFDRELRDVLSVQADVARMIAQQIRIRLTPEQTAQLTNTKSVDPDAFENYLRGRFFWNKRTVEGHQRAIEFFDKAIAIDPGYAKAYAGLADAYALLGSAPNGVLPRAEAMARARAAAQKALSFDEALPDAHASLGFVKMHYDWDFLGAEREFQRAIALNPGYATGHHWYAYDLVPLGRLNDAIAEVQRAQKADPLSVIISRDVGEMLLFAGREDEAIAQCRKTLEMDPNFGLAHWTLSLAYRRKGQATNASEELRSVDRNAPGMISLATGGASEIRHALADLERGVPRAYEVNTQIAGLRMALGDIDGAFAALEGSFLERDGGLIVMAVSPEWQALWPDPRFADLMRRVGVVMPHPMNR
jgi:TolB-like protein/DNA-binding winged helix-turn-helix (wHTH) protein/tetratricopeptide (TPR) repeat protein